MIAPLKEILKYHRKRKLPLVLNRKNKPKVIFHQCYGSWLLDLPEYEWCISEQGVEVWPPKTAPHFVKTYSVS